MIRTDRLAAMLVQESNRRRCLRLAVAASCLMLAGCEQSTTNLSTGPSPVRCQVTPSYGGGTVGANGGAQQVAVSTAAECSWTATASAAWLSNLEPANGQGPGEVRFQVAANPTPAARQGQVTINGVSVTVSQAGIECGISIEPTSATVPAAGGAGSIAVSAPGACTWSASSNASWLVITSEPSGQGNGQIHYSAQANSGAARFGIIAVGGLSFVVTQPATGGPVCANTIAPASQTMVADGGTVIVNVQADPACTWIAVSNVPWLAVAGVGSGTGNGSVTISASPNAGAPRIGTATIAGQTLTITQAGACTSSIAPASQSMPSSGGAGAPVGVQIATGCSWTASTPDSWITITAGASGDGNGSVEFTVAANAGGPRTGTLTIAGHLHTVNQAGGCVVSIDPPSQNVAAAGGAAADVSVTTAADCAWTATTTTSWIAITGGASGTGNGTVEFTVEANTGPQRVGTLIIAGQTHSVTQASGCSYSIDPTSVTLNKHEQTRSVTVTAGTGCAWTAVPNAEWITIESGATGSGNGTVTYRVTQNNGSADRVGTITIAGITFTVTQRKDGES